MDENTEITKVFVVIPNDEKKLVDSFESRRVAKCDKRPDRPPRIVEVVISSLVSPQRLNASTT
jgi:hypothetical protein